MPFLGIVYAPAIKSLWGKPMPYKTPPALYGLWAGMLQRCRNPKAQGYAHYGGRGIRVCERWTNYRNFEADMGPRPSPKHSIDRIDADGDYSPGNCRWATQREQCRNMRITKRVVIEGVEYVAADLADLSGHKTETIVRRAESGLRYEQVMAPELGLSVYDDGRLLKTAAKRAEVRRRNHAEKTHCKHGHEFCPETTYFEKGGKRCRTCRDERMARFLAKQSA